MSCTPNGFASLTATFHPDAEVLRRQLIAVPLGWVRLVVDDGTPDAAWRSIAGMLQEFEDVEVIRLGQNAGLAAAQNAGIRRLHQRGDVTCVLLLDQDSEPCKGAVTHLGDAYTRLQETLGDVGAVGPALVEPDSGLRHGFHVVRYGIWTRVHPASGPPVRCAGLNGSGTLMRLDTALSLGGMDESLFIDMVDAEWSFRLSSQGLALYGVPESTFAHRMGVESMRIWLFGWRVWPRRSPIRNRYVIRNTVRLMRRSYVPAVWKFWAAVKIVMSLVVYFLYGNDRVGQVAAMALGVMDGLKGNGGKIG